MTIFQKYGKKFELPDGTSIEEANAKIDAYMGKSTEDYSGIWGQAKAGASESAVGLISQLASGKYTPKPEPKGALEHISRFAGEQVPDLPLWIGSALGAETGAPLLMAGVKTAGKAGIKAAAKEIAEVAAKSAIKDKLGLLATKGALTFGGVEAVKSPLRQEVTKGDISAGQTLKDLLLSAGLGAVGEPIGAGIGAVGKGLIKGEGSKAIERLFKAPETKKELLDLANPELKARIEASLSEPLSESAFAKQKDLLLRFKDKDIFNISQSPKLTSIVTNISHLADEGVLTDREALKLLKSSFSKKGITDNEIKLLEEQSKSIKLTRALEQSGADEDTISQMMGTYVLPTHRKLSGIGRLFSRFFRPGLEDVKKSGGSGKMLSDMLNRTEYLHESYNSKYISKLLEEGKALDIKDSEMRLFQKAYESNDKSLLKDHPKLLNLWPKWSTIEKGLATELGNRKVAAYGASGKTGEFRGLENYFPREYDKNQYEALLKSWEDPAKAEEAANMLVASGKAKSFQEANGIIQKLMIEKSGFKIGAQYHRVLDTFLEPKASVQSMLKHIDETTHLMAVTDTMGQSGELGNKLVARMAEEGADPTAVAHANELTNRYLKTEAFTGAHNPQLEKIYKSISGVQTVARLGPLTSMLNYFQRFNMIPITGLKSFIESGAYKLKLTPERMLKAIKYGTTIPEKDESILLQKLGGALGGNTDDTNYVSKYLKAIGMDFTEKGNRVAAAEVGEYFGKSLAERIITNPNDTIALRYLSKLDVDAGLIKDLLLNPNEQVKDAIAARVAQSLNRYTQFWYSAFDLPPSWTTPLGKLITQFKPASFYQYQLFKKFMLDEAIKGNIGPMTSFISIGLATGETLSSMRKILRGKEPTRPKGPQRILEDLSIGGGIGIASDLLNTFEYGKPDWFLEQGVGPGITMGIQTTKDLQQLLTKGKLEPMGKSLTRYISPTLSNVLFPPKKR